MMKQQVAIITLGITDIARSKRFYVEGFGWTPTYESHDTVLYQMNGFILSTWLQDALEEDMQHFDLERKAAITLAHNASSAEEVQPLIEHLSSSGGKILRNASSPSHGGVRGYITDPDGHAWEIIWNSAWQTDNQGWVSFKPPIL